MARIKHGLNASFTPTHHNVKGIQEVPPTDTLTVEEYRAEALRLLKKIKPLRLCRVCGALHCEKHIEVRVGI